MLENNLIYQDQYMFFTFNCIYSKTYNLMIQNDKDNVTIHTNSGISIDYASPKYKIGRYMMGVTHSHRSIPYKLVAYGVNDKEIQDIIDWLKAGTVGTLTVDYAPDWQYNVIISKCGDPILYPIDIEHFIMSFDITFETIEGTCAESTNKAYAYIENSIVSSKTVYGVNNSYYIPNVAMYKMDILTAIQKFGSYGAATTLSWFNGANIPVIIHHVYKGTTGFDLTVYPATKSAMGLTITTPTGMSHISYSGTNELQLDYKHLNHLFFLDDVMPETHVLNNTIKNLKVTYGSDALNLTSPGCVELLNVKTLSLDKLVDLTTTPYNWFVYMTKDQINAPYYTLYSKDMSANSYTKDPSGAFLYDLTYKKSVTTTDLDGHEIVTKEDDLESLLSDIKSKTTINNYTNVYFGFYDIIKLQIPNFSAFSITTTQYSDIIGGQIT